MKLKICKVIWCRERWLRKIDKTIFHRRELSRPPTLPFHSQILDVSTMSCVSSQSLANFLAWENNEIKIFFAWKRTQIKHRKFIIFFLSRRNTKAVRFHHSWKTRIMFYSKHRPLSRTRLGHLTFLWRQDDSRCSFHPPEVG